MKKLITLILAVLIGCSLASARDTISRDPNVLPAAARTLINSHFKKVGINHIKIDHKTFGGAEYDVVLNNGTEIEFENDGSWKEIDCGAQAVPSGLILKSISQYVAGNYKGVKIVAIEKGARHYEVTLSNGLDLHFDRSGQFQRIDD